MHSVSSREFKKYSLYRKTKPKLTVVGKVDVKSSFYRIVIRSLKTKCILNKRLGNYLLFLFSSLADNFFCLCSFSLLLFHIKEKEKVHNAFCLISLFHQP